MKIFILKIIKNKKFYVPVVAIVLGIIAYKAIHSMLNRILKIKNNSKAYDEKKRRTIADLCSNIGKYVIVVIDTIIILEAYNIDTASLITGLGVLSAVIGLAFQDALKDFIAGIGIILENYYVVGDMVTYNDFTGEIMELGLKSTKIKKATGEILIVANRNITQIINLSQTKQTVFLELGVAYEENTQKVETTINKILPKLEKIEHVIKNSATYLGINQLADSQVIYQLKLDCTQDNQWQVKRDALRIVKTAFEEDNIKIPYPQIEVHNGKNI